MGKPFSIIVAILFVLVIGFMAYLVVRSQQLPKPTPEQYADSTLNTKQ